MRKSTRGRRGVKPSEEVEEEQEQEQEKEKEQGKEEKSLDKTSAHSQPEEAPPAPAPASVPEDSEPKPVSLQGENQTADASFKESSEKEASFGQENKACPQDVKEEETTVSSAKLEMPVATKEDKVDVKESDKGNASFSSVFSILYFT